MLMIRNNTRTRQLMTSAELLEMICAEEQDRETGLEELVAVGELPSDVLSRASHPS